MPRIIEGRGIDQAGPAYKPPWGLQTPKRDERRDAAFMSTYNRMFQGWKGSAAKPIRQSTAPHLSDGIWNDRSSYKETFRTPHSYSRHSFVPASVNRHERPHPSQIVWPLEPNKAYMIWKPKVDLDPQRQIASAPVSLLQFNKQRWMNTTYSDFFQGQQTKDMLGKVSRPAKTADQRRPAIEDVRTRASSRPATIGEKADKTVYKHDFQGEFARPSTIDKPPDRSWANIRY